VDPGGKLDPVTLVSQESNCFDPDQDPVTKDGTLYLRGVRLPSGANESATVTATMTVPGTTPQTVTRQIGVTVRRQSLGAFLRQDIEDAVVEAASQTGVPPQFLKAQIKTENVYLRDQSYRYEPVTIDFDSIGRDGAPDRNKNYIRRHLFGGQAASPGHRGLCVALTSAGVDANVVNNSGCRVVSAGTTNVVALAEPALVRAREGTPGDPQYRVAYPVAERHWDPTFQGPPPNPPGPLNYLDPPLWSHATNVVNASVGDQDFRFDYETNSVILKQGLAAGEWIKVTYDVMGTPAAVTAGSCSGNLPGGLAFLDGKARCYDDPAAPLQTFGGFSAPPDIETWVRTNIVEPAACHGRNWLNGTKGERHLEFLYNQGGVQPQFVDRRFENATAQFVASGSFGLLQATAGRWLKGDVAILNKAFDLDKRCIWELADPNNANRVKEAVLIAAAAHAASMQQLGPLPFRANQIDWALAWTNAIREYNRNGPEYKPSPRLSNIVERGLRDYTRAP
jgi:hypothetical protein